MSSPSQDLSSPSETPGSGNVGDSGCSSELERPWQLANRRPSSSESLTPGRKLTAVLLSASGAWATSRSSEL